MKEWWEYLDADPEGIEDCLRILEEESMDEDDRIELCNQEVNEWRNDGQN